jgi:hypothetical protein
MYISQIGQQVYFGEFMKIIQIILSEHSSRFGGGLIGLGDDGKVYIENVELDRYGNFVKHQEPEWIEHKIKQPK